MTVTEAMLADPDPQEMAVHAREARDFLKALAHESRLMILCMLCRREMTVAELCAALGQRQPAVSQQLARLREENLVAIRREGKHIHYSIASENARRVVAVLYDIFCKTPGQAGC
ncbi:MAG: metalloregulator ArsR/SmtB family transcription factor [Alphaproteobacteria bacterium]|nr:metalloregulator ArsR/SmtB family transcription factor [Alphaproteobacteria bacterium]MDX5367850.1 metalloregulator ArsR/SmtB family transcription factor [Alphaproteobacteria bacterium]MDX5462723.1 metalloregulator ArsR/SmtB family transcription factor [Alphaproteobacteria bacterium]